MGIGVLVGRSVTGVIGVSNIVAVSCTDDVWLKLLLGVVGLLCTTTMLFYGTLLAHIISHGKERAADNERFKEEFKAILKDELKHHVKECIVRAKTKVDN